MSAAANILVTDVLDTPVTAVRVYSNSATVASNKTYVPIGKVRPNVVSYVDRSGGIQVGYPKYDVEVLYPQNGNRNLRVRESIVLPVMNITAPSTGSGIQPQPSVAFNLRCNREWVIPESALNADRMKLYALAVSFFAGSIYATDDSPASATGIPIRSLIETGEPIFA